MILVIRMAKVDSFKSFTFFSQTWKRSVPNFPKGWLKYQRFLKSPTVEQAFSYSGKESESNDIMMQFEEFSKVHNSDRTSNVIRSNLAHKIV